MLLGCVICNTKHITIGIKLANSPNSLASCFSRKIALNATLKSLWGNMYFKAIDRNVSNVSRKVKLCNTFFISEGILFFNMETYGNVNNSIHNQLDQRTAFTFYGRINCCFVKVSKLQYTNERQRTCRKN